MGVPLPAGGPAAGDGAWKLSRGQPQGSAREGGEVRADLGAGKDPLAERQAERARRLTDERGTVSFREAAEQFIAAHAPGWRNPKHRQQWTNMLATYAHPVIGDLPVAAIDTQFVLRVLEPIWTQKMETASRLRGRIEAVLDWATVRGMRTGENPARWRGHLDKLLPRRARVAPVEHHPALAYPASPVPRRSPPAAGHCGAGFGICHPDGGAYRRGDRCQVG